MEHNFLQQNPLWENSNLIDDDPHLKKLEALPFQYFPRGKRLIFLDEITIVNRWEYAIKHIVDSGLAEDILFILTGSSAVDLRRDGERLPGRRNIINPDRLLLPLNFRQYCLLRKFNEIERLAIKNWHDSLRANLPKLKIFFPKIQSYFHQYLNHGGFLAAISDFLQLEKMSEKTSETYRTVVLSDFEKLRKDRIIVRNIIRHLLVRLATPISWNGLARDSGSISVNTVK